MLGSGNTGRKPDTNNQNLVFRVLFPREYVKYTELGRRGDRMDRAGRMKGAQGEFPAAQDDLREAWP